MKIGLMSKKGPPKCARYTDIWKAMALRDPSFSTSPIKTCHCWISRLETAVLLTRINNFITE
ncbi:GDPD2 [Cervus elaphus hippelaphus]|uniref:GDPD2 n=1 Tax=Cervus elaphus hippelaphus TaxID=46360 RepID=A0A212C044_CEREH|nr:GDPD2 [Cervus elaphus hippelaphus]